MRTEKEIKEALKAINYLGKLRALSDVEEQGRDMLLWVLGKDFNTKKKKK